MYIAMAVIAAVIVWLLITLLITTKRLCGRFMKETEKIISVTEEALAQIDGRLVRIEEMNEDIPTAKGTREAERRMQDGINSILNYSSQHDRR